MDVEYENYAHRASAHADDAETDEEIVIKYRRHRVEPHHAAADGSEDTYTENFKAPTSTVGRLLHIAKSWYRKAIGTADTATLKHKAEIKVDEGVRKFEEKGGKLADYAEEGVGKASKFAQDAVDGVKDALEKEKGRARIIGEDGSHAADYASEKVKEQASEFVYRTQAAGNSWTAWLSDTVSSAWESTKSTFDSLWSWNQIGNRRRKAHMDKLRDSRKLKQEMERRNEELRQAGKTVKDTAEAGKAKVEEILNDSAELGKQKVAESAGWLKEGAERQKAKLEEAIHDTTKKAQDTAEAGKEKVEAVAHEAADKAKEGAEKAKEAAGWIKKQVETKAKEGVQETSEWLKARAEAGKSKVEEVVHNVQDEAHAVKAGVDAAKEKAKESVRTAAGRVKEKVVDGIHDVEKVGEGFIEAVERGGEKIYHVGEGIKEAVEHGGEKIYHGGKLMVKEGAERAARPFIRDTQIHRNKLHGNYIKSSSDNGQLPKQVLTVGDVVPLSEFYAGILGLMYLVLAYRVRRSRSRTGLVVSEHHAIVRRQRVVANLVKEKPKKGQSQSQETLTENSYVEDTQDIALNESVESLTTFTQNTAIALALLTLNEIAGYYAPLILGYLVYIIGSLLVAFGGYDTDVGNTRRNVGLYMVWTVIGVSSIMNLAAGLLDNGIWV